MHEKLVAFNLNQRKSRSTTKLQSGDVVKIHRKIREGSKERTQVFQGTIIAIRGGQSSSPVITVRKVSFGIGVELIMPVLSPQIEKIEFIKRSRVRRAKLYFVRDKSVKVLSRKMKEIDVKTLVASDVAEAAPEVMAPEEKVSESPVPEKTEEAKS